MSPGPGPLRMRSRPRGIDADVEKTAGAWDLWKALRTLGVEATGTAMNLALSELERGGGGPDSTQDNGKKTLRVRSASRRGEALPPARPEVVALREANPHVDMDEVSR